MINRKSIVNSPDDRLRQFNRMPIPSVGYSQIVTIQIRPGSQPGIDAYIITSRPAAGRGLNFLHGTSSADDGDKSRGEATQ